ncbi:MAG: lipoprotein [Legionellales bacterium]|nr:lipoprotein [Legionellales bacterium]
MSRTIFMIVSCWCLIGCGQTGALYLPSTNNAKQHKNDSFLLYHQPKKTNTDE